MRNMRKLVVGTFRTLDGVMQAPGGPNEDRDGDFKHGGWLVPFFDERIGEIMTEWTVRAGAFLLGRKTFDIFAGSWPNSTSAIRWRVGTSRSGLAGGSPCSATGQSPEVTDLSTRRSPPPAQCYTS